MMNAAGRHLLKKYSMASTKPTLNLTYDELLEKTRAMIRMISVHASNPPGAFDRGSTVASSISGAGWPWKWTGRAGITLRITERCASWLACPLMSLMMKSRPSPLQRRILVVLAALNERRPGPVATRNIERVLEQGGDAPVYGPNLRASCRRMEAAGCAPCGRRICG